MLKQCPYSCSVCNEKEHGSKICADRDHDQVYLLYHDQGVGPHLGADYCILLLHGHEQRLCLPLLLTSLLTTHDQCLIWGEHECGNNPGAVMRLCPKMCGLCTLICEDKHADCPAWAAAKEGKGCEADSVISSYPNPLPLCITNLCFLSPLRSLASAYCLP